MACAINPYGDGKALQRIVEAVVSAAETAVSEPFMEKGNVDEILDAKGLHAHALYLISQMPPIDDKIEFQNRADAVEAIIEARKSLLSDEALAALEAAESMVEEPFPTSGTIEQVYAVYNTVKNYIAAINEFLSNAVIVRLEAVLEAMTLRYDALLEKARRDFEAELNQDTGKYEAEVVFDEDNLSIEIQSDEPITDGYVTAIRSTTVTVDATPPNSESAGIYLELQRSENLTGTTMKIRVSYDPADL